MTHNLWLIIYDQNLRCTIWVTKEHSYDLVFHLDSIMRSRCSTKYLAVELVPLFKINSFRECLRSIPWQKNWHQHRAVVQNWPMKIAIFRLNRFYPRSILNILVTLWYWWLTVGDNFSMLATELRYWCLFWTLVPDAKVKK